MRVERDGQLVGSGVCVRACVRASGAIGFGCSLGFLLFVFKFNEYVQAYKARKNIRKGQKVDASLVRALRHIFGRACTRREAATIASL